MANARVNIQKKNLTYSHEKKIIKEKPKSKRAIHSINKPINDKQH